MTPFCSKLTKVSPKHTRLVLFLIVFVSLFFSSQNLFASPSIANISVSSTENSVTMGADLVDGFSPDVIKTIKKGVPITFTYDIELVKNVPFWTDKVISSNTISNTIHYDSLKKAYRFSSIGRNVQNKVLTRNQDRYQKMASTLREIPIASISKLDPDQKYYIRVKAGIETDRFWFPFNYIFFFVPFNDFKTSWTESSPLVWKNEIETASSPFPRRQSRKRNSKTRIPTNGAVRTFNQ